MHGKMVVQNFYEPLVMKLEEHDIPQIADNEVLIKVMACSICGSDVSYYFGHSPLGTPDGKGPLYLGHEMSGVVVEVVESLSYHQQSQFIIGLTEKLPYSIQILENPQRVVVDILHE